MEPKGVYSLYFALPGEVVRPPFGGVCGALRRLLNAAGARRRARSARCGKERRSAPSGGRP